MDRWHDVQRTLAEWRAAERRAARTPPWTAEGRAARHDVDAWREAYHAAVSRETDAPLDEKERAPVA